MIVERILLFRAFAPAFTIFAFCGVLFLGGVLRCRAPWFSNDGARTEDRKSPNSQGSSDNALLEVIAHSKLHKQELLKLLASQQIAKRDGEDTCMSHACRENQWCSGPFRRGVCLENEESQERASERPPLQGAHSGRVISACCTVVVVVVVVVKWSAVGLRVVVVAAVVVVAVFLVMKTLCVCLCVSG